ncbi:hypothetical protein CDAR_582361 [Caerostris darwini]|uniref:Uncharacterized protein n=1 Tax=Caerostris darwini TaxID=1538125 RepID=A0AAV4RG35_9ARAC|nr:hypothetical protein CDAR_582361 [Caerostris darwini]
MSLYPLSWKDRERTDDLAATAHERGKESLSRVRRGEDFLNSESLGSGKKNSTLFRPKLKSFREVRWNGSGCFYIEPLLSLGADFALPGLGWEPGARELLRGREENLNRPLDQIKEFHDEPGAFILERIGSGRISLQQAPTKKERIVKWVL